MSDTVIKVENLSKKYKLGEVKRTDLITMGQKETSSNVDTKKVYWAVKDVSFDVKRGEVIGIIGKNGAGKSTILKLLSKITSPSLGSIKIKGKIASLLEVGTGFHGELSGRDNIYLNGGILGMNRHEINRKFDEIVDFAGVEQFIDTPVKRYSSGMYVRLAFAVAAHLEPDILIIDEVLAVGDIEFQKKCLGKMKDVSSAGRTVLFVSHQMNSVRQLCTRGLFLSKGSLHYEGNIDQTIALYQDSFKTDEFNQYTDVTDETRRRGNGWLRFSSIDVCNTTGEEQKIFSPEDPIQFNCEFICNHTEPVSEAYFAVALFYAPPTGEKIRVTSLRHKLTIGSIRPGESKKIKVVIQPKLRPKEYSTYFWLDDENARPYDVVDDVIDPIIIKSNDSYDELGYDPSYENSGFFDVSYSIDNI